MCHQRRQTSYRVTLESLSVNNNFFSGGVMLEKILKLVYVTPDKARSGHNNKVSIVNVLDSNIGLLSRVKLSHTWLIGSLPN
jgi:hypothetical protein